MSDADVVVIGRAGFADLSPAHRKAEARLGRGVNVTVYSPEEFRGENQIGRPFPCRRFTRTETVCERKPE
jgi:hypothetical protein